MVTQVNNVFLFRDLKFEEPESPLEPLGNGFVRNLFIYYQGRIQEGEGGEWRHLPPPLDFW